MADFDAAFHFILVKFSGPVPERRAGILLGLEQAGYDHRLEVAERGGAGLRPMYISYGFGSTSRNECHQPGWRASLANWISVRAPGGTLVIPRPVPSPALAVVPVRRPLPHRALQLPLAAAPAGSGALVPLAAGPSALDRHRAGDGWWALRAYGCSSATAGRRSPAGSASPRCPDPARGHLPAGLVAEPVHQPEDRRSGSDPVGRHGHLGGCHA